MRNYESKNYESMSDSLQNGSQNITSTVNNETASSGKCTENNVDKQFAGFCKNAK